MQTMFRLTNPTNGMPLFRGSHLLRAFSRSTAAKDKNPMAGRYKPKKILNFDSKQRYILYKSDFARPSRAVKFVHPKQGGFSVLMFSTFLMLLMPGFAYWLHKR